MEDKYLTYSSIALAGEDAFVQLVRHGENKDKWHSWLTDHPERQKVFEEAERVVLSLDTIPQAVISAQDKQQLWENISSKVSTGNPDKKQSRVKGLWTWGLAAAASLALLFWFGSEAGKSKVYASAGEHKEIILPEKSIVSLNADGRLIYDEKSFNKERSIHLSGEAFFDVEPGSTFKVLTDEGTVTVVGTSFNVLARDGKFEVSCYTGKVRVERSADDKTELTTGQKTSVSSLQHQLISSAFDAKTGQPDWIKGIFKFDNQPLFAVIEELERQYDVEVVLADGLEEISYTGLFETGDLAKALQLITWPLHLESTVKGKTITIKR